MHSRRHVSTFALLLLAVPQLATSSAGAPQRARTLRPSPCFEAEYPAWRLAAPRPRDAEAGDYDGDGDVDIAVCRSGGTDLWFRRARRDYVLQQTLAAPTGPLESGDVDGDGDLDLVLVPGAVRVSKNNGSGTFLGQSSHPTIATSSRPLLSDLDGDGDLDVVVEGNANEFAVLLNTGTGAFAPSVAYAGGGRVAVADLDGDADLDVAAAAVGSTSVNLHENAGDGTFSLRASMPGSPVWYLFADDLDGDGANDVAEADNAASVRVFSNLGSWSFASSAPIPVGTSNRAFGGADVDGDGDIDLAVEDPADFWLLENHGDGTFDAPQRFPNGATFEGAGFEFTHLDADGRLDVLAVNTHGHVVTLREGRPGGTLENASRHPLAPYAYRIAAGKLDADSRDDLVLLASEGSDTKAIVAMNAGSDDFVETEIPLADPTFVALGDLDGDGADDLVVSGATGLSWLPNDGAGHFGAPTALLASTETQGVAVEDMDLDGDEDIVVNWLTGNQIVVLRNDGSGLFQSAGSVSVSSPVRMALGDLNADGFPDAAITHGNTEASWFFNQGDGLLGTRHFVSLDADVIRSVDIGDVNGDGRGDVVALDEGDWDRGVVQVLLTDGSGGVLEPLLRDVGPFARHVLVRDLDGDGDRDVVASSWETDGVSILRNEGFGQFLEHEQYPAGPSGFGVVATDLDQDGIIDLAVANWETVGPSPGGYTILYGRCR